MSTVEAAIEELKHLPPVQQDEAARFIHSLKGTDSVRKQAAIQKTVGCLSQEEAAEWEASIEECSQVDHESW